MNIEKSKPTAYLLNILIPGLGHIYWKEYLFGIFIFLIMLIAIILYLLTLFVALPLWAILIVSILPAIFYIFTFVDLSKTINTKLKTNIFSRKKIITFLIVGLIFQIFIPLAPANFLIQNFPEYLVVEKNDLSPVFQQGNILKVSRLSYIVDFNFLKKPILHALPDRYDIIRYEDDKGKRHIGIVIGLPGEEIEMAEGVVVVNGIPDYTQPGYMGPITGECQLTYVDQYNILVGMLNLGTLKKFEPVPLVNLIGEVDKAF